jgi:hypothetical protein
VASHLHEHFERNALRATPVLLTGALLAAVALSGCGGTASSAPKSAAPTATATPRQTTVTVSLYHCGINPLHYDGQTWKVPIAPFDETIYPAGWKGTGTVVKVTPTQVSYRDDSGVAVVFVPDDGTPAPLCY